MKTESSQSWVSVKERLPGEGKVWWTDNLLVTNGISMWVDSYYHPEHGEKGFWLSRHDDITHWQNLPSKPENK